MIKHIFCDLDGTLYNKGISKEDIKAIEEIEKETNTSNLRDAFFKLIGGVENE